MNRENEFAFILGQLIGILSSNDIQDLLRSKGIPDNRIEAVMEELKSLAQIFYR